MLFKKNTKWSKLYYPIIDTHSCINDIQITYGRKFKSKAAAITNNLKNLNYPDAIEDIQNFNNFKLPSVCFIKNMAYYLVETMIKTIAYLKSNC